MLLADEESVVVVGAKIHVFGKTSPEIPLGDVVLVALVVVAVSGGRVHPLATKTKEAAITTSTE